jgi:phospholipase/carboxylesterase
MTIHDAQPVLTAGSPLQDAKAAMIMVHGRGASAKDILQLAREFDQKQVAYLAPQAAGNTWYPYRFIEPVEKNEPALSSALTKVGSVLKEALAAGIPAEKVALLGFSQGACLATEYAARNPQRYGGIIALSGGLIGELGKPLVYPAGSDVAGTPVFFGCSDVDFHIPKERVEESAQVFRKMNGDVTVRLYPGMGHTVNEDEINFVHELLGELVR